MKSAAARWWPIAALIGVVAVLCADRLMDRSYPLPNPIETGADLTGYFYPAIVYARSVFAAGEIPFWNPYQMAGSPFLAAHQPAVLYPPLVALLWLPPLLAITAHGLLHVLLAGLLTYGYARRIGMYASAALAAALAYMLSYAVLESLFNTAYLSSYVWLPAVLWGVYETVDARSAKGVFLLGTATALGVLSGHAQAFFYIAQLAAVYGAVVLAARPRRVHACALAAAAVALGLGAALAQIAATAELGRTATRSFAGLPLAQAGVGFPEQLLRDGLTGDGMWATISVLTIPLAIVALAAPGARLHAAFFAVAALFWFDFLRGAAGYVYPVYYHLPFGALFRLPARAAFAYAFCSAMLIGLGGNALLRALAGRPRLLALAAIALPAVIGIEAYRRGDVRVRYLPLTDPHLLDAPASLVDFAFRRAQYDRMFLERNLPAPVQFNIGQMHEVFVVPEYEPLLPARYREFFGMPGDRPWPGGFTILGAWGPQSAVDPKVLDLLSVRYYVDLRSNRTDSVDELARRAGAIPLAAYDQEVSERTSAMPRAYVVHEATTVGSAADALAAVKHAGFDARRTAVIEGAADLEPLAPDAWEYARILDYGPNRVELEVRCASRCLAVLTDLDYPGWRASLDGTPTAIIRANYLLRAVVVPAGVHVLRYRYRPTHWAALAGVSIASAAVLLTVGLAALLRRRH